MVVLHLVAGGGQQLVEHLKAKAGGANASGAAGIHQLGFELFAGGETVFFWNSDLTRVIDVIDFRGP